ncbi:uncharacterized protein LOC120192129 [Hibiscus syriacus]|uniref:uncharacterized protein LOC120192129 n=1 Tax=Hibiscus syriacus TaxID=106335 RepID=UPI001924926A|nr:uncharacterized protein LOC120192129 [Hibiscus syriacus]
MRDLSIADSWGKLSSKVVSKVMWVPPPQGFFKLNVDGAVTEDWMKGGIGGIIKDAGGSLLALFSEAIGKGSPTIAKILVIKRGLDISLLCLLFNQIVEIYKDKDVEIRHISREANWEADKLAKEGIE